MPFTYGRRSINGPMSTWFQANDHQLSLEIPNFNKVGYRRCEGCNLGCSLTCAVVALEFMMVQMHLNSSNYSLNSMCQNYGNYPILL